MLNDECGSHKKNMINLNRMHYIITYINMDFIDGHFIWMSRAK